jgi:hypothetical protein
MVSLPGVSVGRLLVLEVAVALGVAEVPVEQAASASDALAIAIAANALRAPRREVEKDIFTFHKDLVRNNSA